MAAVRKRVLVSESNDALRSMLATALFREELDIDTAADPDQTLERLLSCDYAVLVIAINEGTKEALNRYRQLRPEATTFVIAVTDGLASRIGPELIHARIEKPFEIGFIAQLIRDCARVVELPDDPLECPPAENPGTRRFDETGDFRAN